MSSSTQAFKLISETLVQIICKNQNPLIQSHPDIILSRFSISPIDVSCPPDDSIVAPKVENKRVKIQCRMKVLPIIEILLGKTSHGWEKHGVTHQVQHPCPFSSQLHIPFFPLLPFLQTSLSYSLHPQNQKPRHHPTIKALQKTMLTNHKTLANLTTANSNHSEISLANQEYLKAKKC